MIDLSQLSPSDLFYTQKETFFKKDMDAVKEMAQIAKLRLKFPLQKDWSRAKEELDRMEFPESISFRETRQGEFHMHRHELHKLSGYVNKERIQILGYEVSAYYNYCRECAEVRNKSLTIFNPETNTCYERILKHKGKDPKTSNTIQEVAEMFMSIFLFAL